MPRNVSLGDRNITPYPIIPGSLDAGKKKRNPPARQKTTNEIVSSFTALNVESLTEDLYQDSGLLFQGKVFQELFDPSMLDKERPMVFEKNEDENDINEFDFKKLSYEEKKLLLKRLEEAEEKGFFDKQESPVSTPSNPPESPDRQEKKPQNNKKTKKYTSKHNKKFTDKSKPPLRHYKRSERQRSPSPVDLRRRLQKERIRDKSSPKYHRH